MRYALYLILLLLPVFLSQSTHAQPTGKAHPDMNGDGAVSIAEAIKSQENLFLYLDTDDDLSLSLFEIKKHADEFSGDPDAWDLKQSFDHMDKDDSNSLTEIEYLEGVITEFRQSDRDRDYFITTYEMPG